MPKLEFLEKLYPNQESAYLDKLNQYYNEGSYKDTSYTTDKVYNRQISLEEYNWLKNFYLNELHKFNKKKLKQYKSKYQAKYNKAEFDNFNDDPEWWIGMKLRNLRNEEHSKKIIESVKNKNVGSTSFKGYSKGFVSYDKNDPSYPLVFFLQVLLIVFGGIFLISWLLTLIF